MTQYTAARFVTGAEDANAIQRFVWSLADTAVLTRRNLVRLSAAAGAAAIRHGAAER